MIKIHNDTARIVIFFFCQILGGYVYFASVSSFCLYLFLVCAQIVYNTQYHINFPRFFSFYINVPSPPLILGDSTDYYTFCQVYFRASLFQSQEHLRLCTNYLNFPHFLYKQLLPYPGLHVCLKPTKAGQELLLQ